MTTDGEASCAHKPVSGVADKPADMEPPFRGTSGP